MIVRKGNLPALALYEKNGFVLCGETYLPEHDLHFHCYEMIFGNDLLLFHMAFTGYFGHPDT